MKKSKDSAFKSQSVEIGRDSNIVDKDRENMMKIYDDKTGVKKIKQ